MKLKPMKDLIYVKPVEPEYKGKLVLPESSREDASSFGEVKAIGPECEELKVGDIVIHKRVTGLEFKFEDDVMLAMHEPEVLAVAG